MDIRKNRDCFSAQHQLTGFYNRNGVFTVRYELKRQPFHHPLTKWGAQLLSGSEILHPSDNI